MGINTPIPGTIESVPHLPDYVCIYRIPSSKFWWCRIWVAATRRYLKRSTKSSDHKKACAFAKQFYIDSLITNSNGAVAKNNPHSLNAVAESLLTEERANGKHSRYIKDKQMLHNKILPYFKGKLLSDIGYNELTEYLGTLNQNKLSPATKKHYMGLIGKVFGHGIKLGVIGTKPAFPKLGEKRATLMKRDYLTLDEYRKLNNTTIRMWKAGVTFRGTPITLEHKLLVNFMINSFIRPTDLTVLKHQHIQRATDNGSKWLILNHPATKTTADPVHTMPRAAVYYDELLKFRNGEMCAPSDYVFFPEYTNREHGIKKLGRMFSLIVKESGIGEATGKNITLYSLRHTSLMYRILYSDVDVLTLAKNARTSIQQLQDFYLVHLTTDQARRRLHGFAAKRS